jgi:cell wall-associated NlpC family hydrolase
VASRSLATSRSLRLPALVLIAAAGLAAAVVLVAVGAGLTGPAAGTCPPAAGVGTVAAPGVSLDAVQIADARVIYAVGAGLGLPARAEIIAIATAMQESGLRNLAYGLADSLGLFQQRPSQGWGSAAQIMDPVTASRSFYRALTRVAGWQALTVTAAAQAVQRSAFPGAYARWQPIATRLVASLGGTAASCAVLAANVVPASARAELPRHYRLPGDTPGAALRAIRFALAQLGTSYQFGGTCTDARSPDMALHCDCSSLVQQAYRAGGVTLPRTTYAQVDQGTPVYSLSALRPGDLLFTAGADGTPANPGHVGMYIGDSEIVQAPQTGEDVQLSTLSSWAAQIVAMRRIA